MHILKQPAQKSEKEFKSVMIQRDINSIYISLNQEQYLLNTILDNIILDSAKLAQKKIINSSIELRFDLYAQKFKF